MSGELPVVVCFFFSEIGDMIMNYIYIYIMSKKPVSSESMKHEVCVSYR